MGVLQRKTVQILKLAGEMGKLEREPVVDPDVKARLRYRLDVNEKEPGGWSVFFFFKVQVQMQSVKVFPFFLIVNSTARRHIHVFTCTHEHLLYFE